MHISRKGISVLNNIFCHFAFIDSLVSLEGSDHPPIWISQCTHYDFLLTTNALSANTFNDQESCSSWNGQCLPDLFFSLQITLKGNITVMYMSFLLLG